MPVEDERSWTSGARALALVEGAQADPALSSELDEAFPDSTDEL